MSFTYTVTRQDMLDYHIYHLAQNPRLRGYRLVYRLALPLLAGVLLVALYLQMRPGYDPGAERVLLGGSLALGWALLAGLWQPLAALIIRAVAKNAAGKRVPAGYSSENTLTLGESGLHLVARRGGEQRETTATWADVGGIATGPAQYYLLLANSVIVVPFSAFASQEQKARFTHTVEQKREAAG